MTQLIITYIIIAVTVVTAIRKLIKSLSIFSRKSDKTCFSGCGVHQCPMHSKTNHTKPIRSMKLHS